MNVTDEMEKERDKWLAEVGRKRCFDLDEGFKAGYTAALSKAEPVGCPDCGRPKAKTVEDVARGDCPKWWAIRDEMAEMDCDRHRDKQRSLSLPGKENGETVTPSVDVEPVAWRVLDADGKWHSSTNKNIALHWEASGFEAVPLYLHPPVQHVAGWQPIETAPKHTSVILQSWWKHQPTAPMIFEGYLDWDGVTWRYQKGGALSPDITNPEYWQPLPAPMPAAATEVDHG